MTVQAAPPELEIKDQKLEARITEARNMTQTTESVSKYHRSNRDVFLFNADEIGLGLPSNFYTLAHDPYKGFYLEVRNSFSMPEKVYGSDLGPFIERVLNTFTRRVDKNLGVLLSGPKGTGKTVTAKILANTAASRDFPVITVTAAFGGNAFMSFLHSIGKPCVIFIDEFEKIYSDKSSRLDFLSLLDGAATCKHLYVFTSNQEDIGEYFIGRPGRVRYHKKYETLDKSIIRAIIDDKVADPALNTSIKQFVTILPNISIDSLSCIIEESLLHNEPPQEFADIINIKTDSNAAFDVRAVRWEPVFVLPAPGGQTHKVLLHPSSEIWNGKYSNQLHNDILDRIKPPRVSAAKLKQLTAKIADSVGNIQDYLETLYDDMSSLRNRVDMRFPDMAAGFHESVCDGHDPDWRENADFLQGKFALQPSVYAGLSIRVLEKLPNKAERSRSNLEIPYMRPAVQALSKMFPGVSEYRSDRLIWPGIQIDSVGASDDDDECLTIRMLCGDYIDLKPSPTYGKYSSTM